VIQTFEKKAKKIVDPKPKDVQTVDQAAEQIQTAAAKNNIKVTADLTGMDLENAQIASRQLSELMGKHGCDLKKVSLTMQSGDTYASVWGNNRMEFNIQWFKKSRADLQARIRKDIDNYFHPAVRKGQEVHHMVTHEFGHTIYSHLYKDYGPSDPRRQFHKELLSIRKRYRNELKKIRDEFIKANPVPDYFAPAVQRKGWTQKLRKTQRDQGVFISEYAMYRNKLAEFFSEGFADALHSAKPSKFSKEVLAAANKYRKKTKPLISRPAFLDR